MSVRTQGILAGVGFVLLILLWFFVGFRPQQNRINELRDQQETTEQEIAQLQAELERLQELQRMEPQLRAQAARLQDALPNDPRLPDFILQIQEAANLAGIDFLSISPSLPAPFTPPGEGATGEVDLQAISVSIQTTGRFFEMEDFIIRLENLARAVRINTFALSPGGAEEGEDVPGGSPTLSVTFQLQMFLQTAAPVASVPAATPPPAASPTPVPAETPAAEEPATDETPVPGETPAPTPVGG